MSNDPGETFAAAAVSSVGSFYDFGDMAAPPEPLGKAPDPARQVVDECELLAASHPGILDVLVATSDGMLVHSTWDDVEGMRAAAVFAATLGIGQRIASDFGDGGFQDASISTADRVVVTYAIGASHLLGIVADSESLTPGMLLHEARRSVDKLAKLLGGG
jgi:predicted regulator of Ras-like GTPase activity (Roadblock/LC7/MglB family)